MINVNKNSYFLYEKPEDVLLNWLVKNTNVRLNLGGKNNENYFYILRNPSNDICSEIIPINGTVIESIDIPWKVRKEKEHTYVENDAIIAAYPNFCQISLLEEKLTPFVKINYNQKIIEINRNDQGVLYSIDKYNQKNRGKIIFLGREQAHLLFFDFSEEKEQIVKTSWMKEMIGRSKYILHQNFLEIGVNEREINHMEEGECEKEINFQNLRIWFSEEHYQLVNPEKKFNLGELINNMVPLGKTDSKYTS